ncbi:hypothetical protein HCN51_41965 [Nonomuraea sp. FMUSA5-5]|uniref:Rieske domain-containing protein n=1 Tax=Nonomuraea composti TaxID=2720023 RepID=A0ABX1BDR9_9ACTN|nr:hypothetical protein [Nonomuraea sp. FMUSA5-5]NJP95933.1 hypothetical protein [Nonomuraea sp. FMUSA5-5]
MPVSRRELHDLLEERSRPAIERPVPWERLRARTRAVRRRRLTVAAVAGVAAASVVAAGFLVRPQPSARVLEPREAPVPAAAPTADVHELPARFEEADGTVYRRVATATLDAPKRDKVTFEVKVSGKPLAIMADCPAGTRGSVPQVRMVRPGPDVWALTPMSSLVKVCDRHQPTDLVPFPEGTRRGTLSITMPKPSKAIPGERARRWRFGVYEWTPPATMPPAPAPVAPPKTFGGAPPDYRLVGSASAVWPAAREVTVSVPPPGGQWALVIYCGGGLGGRLTGEVYVNGRPQNMESYCPEPPSADRVGFSMLGAARPGPDGKVTVRVRLSSAIPEYQRRPGTLTVAVYDSTR